MFCSVPRGKNAEHKKVVGTRWRGGAEHTIEHAFYTILYRTVVGGIPHNVVAEYEAGLEAEAQLEAEEAAEDEEESDEEDEQ